MMRSEFVGSGGSESDPALGFGSSLEDEAPGSVLILTRPGKGSSGSSLPLPLSVFFLGGIGNAF